MTEVVLRNQEFIHILDSMITTLKETDLLTPEFDKVWAAGEKVKKLPASFPGRYGFPKPHLTLDALLPKIANPHIGSDIRTGYATESCIVGISTLTQYDPKLAEKFKTNLPNTFLKLCNANAFELLHYYPPGGYIGWHTNENNSGYQFIFTWSEKGDGYFQYYDSTLERIINIPDKPGWQVRRYHFGDRDNNEVLWHSAYTDCKRITMCVKFNNTITANKLHLQLESEE